MVTASSFLRTIAPTILVVGAVVGCGSRTSLDIEEATAPDAAVADDAGRRDARDVTAPDAATPFPLGTYASCAQGFYGSDGNVFLNTSGVQDGASLVLTQNGSLVDAVFTDQNDEQSHFTFQIATSTTGTLSGNATGVDFAGLCVQGPGDEGSFPATVDLTSGALTFDESTVFLSASGTATGGDDTPCGSQSEPVELWIVCGGTTTRAPLEPSPVAFPSGSYACTSEIGSYLFADGLHEYATSGGTGSLTITSNGATGSVEASYSGDPSVSGGLPFDVTSKTTASALPSGLLEAQCTVPIDTMTGPSDALAPLSIEGASIVMDGSNVTLSFRGTMTASCTGALVMGSLLCTPQ